MDNRHFYRVACEVVDAFCPENNGMYLLDVCVFGPKHLGQIRELVVSSMNYDDPERLVRVRRLWPAGLLEYVDTIVYTGLYPRST